MAYVILGAFLFVTLLIGTFSRELFDDDFEESAVFGLGISYVWSSGIFVFASIVLSNWLLSFCIWLAIGFVFSVYRWKIYLENSMEDRNQHYDDIRIFYLLFCWPLAMIDLISVTSLTICRKLADKFLSFYGS